MKILVVYLVREQDAIMPFLISYEKHPSGIDHDILFLTKGNKVILPVEVTLINTEREMFVSDFGGSIHAFSKVIRKYWKKYTHFCFLNSWSRILCDGWLTKLCEPFSSQVYSTGIVGASASYESFQSTEKTFFNQFLFPKFPNPHIRTNGFVILSELARKIFPRFCYSKKQEYLFESGKNSMSKKAKEYGFEIFVASTDNIFYLYSDKLKDSMTYRLADQSKLLIEDNQTNIFHNSTPERKVFLSFISWGI